jgi:hypothetical protein
MANAWFRMYSEFATDPKVQMLSEVNQRRYVMLLCMRCSNDNVTLHDEEVAFQLRVTDEEWMVTKAALMSKGMIDEDAKPCAWDKRQYISDSSTSRVAAYRERMKQKGNVTETKSNALDTDTDTDTDNKKPVAAKAARVKFDPLPMKPANVSEQVWAEWCQARSESRKPLTKAMCTAQAKQLDGHGNADEVIRKSIAAGWQGLFPDSVKSASARHSGFDQIDYMDGLTVAENGSLRF